MPKPHQIARLREGLQIIDGVLDEVHEPGANADVDGLEALRNELSILIDHLDPEPA